jgi:putative sigma-54 modulation protein
MQMNINITSVKFDADVKLKDFISEKLNKLSKFYDKISGADVFLRIDNKDAANKTVEIILHIPGNDLFAKKQNKSFEAAADEVTDALKSQLMKHKEKIKK